MPQPNAGQRNHGYQGEVKRLMSARKAMTLR